MEKLIFIRSRVFVIPNENVDTDQIIPARFLKATDKVGFGEKLFYDWRYNSDGSYTENDLNNRGKKCKTLLAGRNFGCGSSREHAAWAIADYGFRVVVSTKIADIFKNNAFNNGVLPLEVSEEFYKNLSEILKDNPETDVFVDVLNSIISVADSELAETFQISNYKRECFIKGLDDIDYLVHLKNEIESYEEKHSLITG